MPSWKSFSYMARRAAGGTLWKVTWLRGMGDQIAREARARAGASVGWQGERVRDIVSLGTGFLEMRGAVGFFEGDDARWNEPRPRQISNESLVNAS